MVHQDNRRGASVLELCRMDDMQQLPVIEARDTRHRASWGRLVQSWDLDVTKGGDIRSYSSSRFESRSSSTCPAFQLVPSVREGLRSS